MSMAIGSPMWAPLARPIGRRVGIGRRLAAPDLLRRAVRALRCGGDGLRYASRRVQTCRAQSMRDAGLKLLDPCIEPGRRQFGTSLKRCDGSNAFIGPAADASASDTRPARSRSRTATRNASNLLVGSEIRANTRSRNTSSPPAASSSKPNLSYARHNASHRSPPVTTRSPTAPAAATCPGRGPARPARQPAAAAPRSSAPPARRGHARTPDARSGATHAARSARSAPSS